MFTNIILFIIAIFLFHISQDSASKGDSIIFTLSLLGANYLVFAFYCRFSFERLIQRLRDRKYPEGSVVNIYQGLTLQLSIIALCLFALDLYFLDLVYWLQQVPGFEHSLFLQGITAIALFILYLGAIWFFSQPAYQIVFQARVSRHNFMRSHFRLNVPILIPWASLILINDLLPFLPWPGLSRFFDSYWGQIFTVCGLMLLLLLFFLPRYIPYWWGCKPFPASAKLQDLESFLRSKGFKYRGLLSWPLFEGRMLTAGIMGIIPRYRYLLVTDGLMEVLSVDELKAVLAHEMGHARYYHMLLYFAFMLAFTIPLGGLEMLPGWLSFIGKQKALLGSLFPLMVYLPFLLLLLLYFRFVLGFFMRHFERQADLYSVHVMGTPEYTINSLEKIALLSGKIRDLPSWHHFSIRQRVGYLEKTLNDRGVIKRYNRFIALCLGAYFVVMIGLMSFSGFSPADQKMGTAWIEELHNNPLEAIKFYEQILKQEPDNPLVLNNLAWFLLKTTDPGMKDPKRALDLAKKAVALEKNAEVLDTLAEAYYANGFTKEAIAAAREALNLATDNIPFYKKQVERFESGK